MNRDKYFYDSDIFEAPCRKHEEHRCMGCVDDMLREMVAEIAEAWDQGAEFGMDTAQCDDHPIGGDSWVLSRRK